MPSTALTPGPTPAQAGQNAFQRPMMWIERRHIPAQHRSDRFPGNQPLHDAMDTRLHPAPRDDQGPLLSDCAQLRQFVANAGDAIIAADRKGIIVLWNRAAERIFGFTEMEALDRSLDLIIPMRQRPRHWDGFYETVETGVTRYAADVLRVPALHKNGHTLSIAFTVCLLFDTSHDVSAIVAIVRDETRRYREEQALRRRLTQLEAATDESSGPRPGSGGAG